MKKLSVKLLCYAERMFLWAHGWHRLDGKSRGWSADYWLPPRSHPGGDHSMHRHSHAVNSVKFWIYAGGRKKWQHHFFGYDTKRI